MKALAMFLCLAVAIVAALMLSPLVTVTDTPETIIGLLALLCGFAGAGYFLRGWISSD